MLSSLDLTWATRVGGEGRTERRYLDFVIDGVALCSRFRADFIPPLGWFADEEQLATIERLRRKMPPDLARYRTALCICPDAATSAVARLAFRSKAARARTAGNVYVFMSSRQRSGK
jgi:hypothetical protein